MSQPDSARLMIQPQESPAYGGGQITLTLHNADKLDTSHQYYLYIEGSSQCHACTTTVVSDDTLQTCIPDHDTAETVRLTILQGSDADNDLYTPLYQKDFTYLHDSAYHVAQFLLENAQESQTLEKLDPENFEYVSRPAAHDPRSFDERLSLAFAYIGLPHHWTIINTESDVDISSTETLLHFAARFGLVNVTAYFLDKPGSDVARFLPNRHGYDPKDVSILYGYNEVADLYTGVTSIADVLRNHNIVRSTNAGCFLHTPKGTTTLTTIPAYYGYTMGDTVGILKQYCESQPSSPRTPISDVPHTPTLPPRVPTLPPRTPVCDAPHTPTYPGSPGTKHRDMSQPMTAHNGHIVISSNQNQRTNQKVDTAYHSDENTDENGDSVFNSQESLLDKPGVDGAGMEADESSIGTTDVYPQLEDSLQCLRGINLDLQLIRDRDRNVFLNIQESRRNDLKRLSASCPTLGDCTTTTPLSPVIEEGHPVPAWPDAPSPTRATPQSPLTITSLTKQLTEHSTAKHVKPNGDRKSKMVTERQTSAVQITINDECVDPCTELTNQLYGANVDVKSPRRHKLWSVDSCDAVKVDRDRRSFKANMLATSGKSLSLNSLESDTEERHIKDASPLSNTSRSSLDSSDNPILTSSECLLNQYNLTLSADASSRTLSPSSMSPECLLNQYNLTLSADTSSRTLSPSSMSPECLLNQYNLTLSADASSRTLSHSSSNLSSTSKQPYSPHEYMRGSSSDLSNDTFLSPPTTMHKSVSSPSLPDTNAAELRLTAKENLKQQHAQIRRQAGIEEDEDESLNQILKADDARNKRMSTLAFMRDSADSEDRNKSTKEDKRKKSGVLSLLSRGSYRVKKGKDRDKSTTHQFMSVSVSTSILCAVCGKSLANKPALSCQACMLNVHENSCKDQISTCSKYRMKLPIERPSSLTSSISQDPPPSSNSTVKSVQSFKEKRSSSTPARTQAISTASLINLQRSSTSPNSPLASPPVRSSSPRIRRSSVRSLSPLATPSPLASPDPVFSPLPSPQLSTSSRPVVSFSASFSRGLTGAGQQNWQKAATLLGLHRVISEEGTDFKMAPTTDLVCTNMTDNMSASVESLDEMSGESTEFDEDPELAPLVPEVEAWSVTIDSRVLKKMNSKDIKRQDTIWELIQTEVHHCRALKTLQKLYRRGMATELLMQSEVLNQIFPRLDDLVEFHLLFLAQLRQLQMVNANQSVDEIGPLLVTRFSGEYGEQMTNLYGEFCSRHEDAVKVYKDYLKSDRKFYAFIQRCDKHTSAQKRDIPGFILLISQRITKYPILIETILKSTKDKKDRESLIDALKLSKEIISEINQQVDAHIKSLRLLEICDKIDSRPTLYRGNKFRKTDILKNGRKLIHEDKLGLRSSRGKVIDVTALILSDLILFLQESNQKYTFVTQDTKPSALSLYRLLVREKSDTRDTRGIYLISQNKHEAEMYELVCKSAEQRQSWITTMRSAIDRCPEQYDVPTETEQDRRVTEVQEARSSRIREIIDMLHAKDQQIKKVCDEKNRLFGDLLEVYNRELPGGRLADDNDESYDVRGDHDTGVSDVLLAAIEEASRLTVMLQASGGVSSLSRSVSSVGEHVSASYPLIPPVPKRAETFAGFDHHEAQQKGLLKKRYVTSMECNHYVPHEGAPTSTSPLTDLTDHASEDSLMAGHKTCYQTTTTPSPCHSHSHLSDLDDADTKLSDRSSEHGSSIDEQDSLGELIMPFQSPMAAPTPHDQIISFTQLGQYLHTIVHLTAQQGTAVEMLRAQLHEANDKINKLSADMSERNTSTNRHNQLEELRNLQESINRERQEWERERDDEKANLETERVSLQAKRASLDREKNDLKAKKDEFQRQRELFQKQIDLLRENGILQNDNTTVSPPKRNSTNSVNTSALTSTTSTVPSDQISHKRSASAELPTKPDVTNNAIVKRNESTSRYHKPANRYSIPSTTNPVTLSATQSFTGKQQLPSHLMSYTNEQKTNVVTHKVPLKGNIQQTLPFKLASTSSLNNNPSVCTASSMPMKLASSSSLAQVKKLAEPTPRPRHEKTTSKLHESRSTSQLDDRTKEKSDNSVIYF